MLRSFQRSQNSNETILFTTNDNSLQGTFIEYENYASIFASLFIFPLFVCLSACFGDNECSFTTFPISF